MARAREAGPAASDLIPLHPHDFRILMAVVEAPSYGTEIVRVIEAAEQGPKLYPANLFRRIRDLLRRGLLEECPAPEGADPRRSYVRLTQMGRQTAQAEARRLRDLVSAAAALDLLPGG